MPHFGRKRKQKMNRLRALGVRTRPMNFGWGNRMKLQLLAAAAVASMGMVAATPASAVINAPVPVANYIVSGGLDWAWAGPCAPFSGAFNGSCNIGGADTMTAYQAGQGWRIPTMAEFAARPAVIDFSAGGICASAWFGSGHNHCDFGDLPIFDYGYGGGRTDLFAETWFVRGAGGAVPEPATWALMITGFGLVGATLRRRRTVAA